MPGFQPPEGEADEQNYASEQGIRLYGTCAYYWSRHLKSNALMWGTAWPTADHFVPADRKQLFRQLRPDLYHSHNFRDNSRILILSEFQSQEKISTVLRTSDTRADFFIFFKLQSNEQSPATLRTSWLKADICTLKTQKQEQTFATLNFTELTADIFSRSTKHFTNSQQYNI